MFGERIRLLRKDYKMTQSKLAEYLGFKSASAIGMLERDEREVSFETLSKIADCFQVSTDYLLGKTETVICPKCSYEYLPLYSESCLEHKVFHNNFLNFKEKDLYLNYFQREDLKKKSRRIIESNALTPEKLNATIALYRCYYSRSVESSNFSNDHPVFNEFIAMMLNREKDKEYLPVKVYIQLVKNFGLKEGIPDGESYAPKKTNVKLDNIEEKEEIKEINEKQRQIDTVAAHLEDKNLTPKKVKLIQNYIDALFDEEDD